MVKRKNFLLAPPARKDLRDILNYIGQENLVAAEQMRERFDDAFHKLGDNPHMGSQRDDLTESPLRFWPVHRSYMIIYDATTDPVRIIRVYNSAQDILGILPH